MTSLYLPGVSIILSIILIVVYFLHKKVSIYENRFYIIMMFCILFDSILVFSLFYYFYHVTDYNFLMVGLVNKFDYMFLITWASCLLLYIMTISSENKNNSLKKIRLVTILNIIFYVVVLILPIDVIVKSSKLATTGGLAVIFSFMTAFIYLIVSLFITFKNIKHLNKKYIPVFLFIVVALFLVINFVINPYFVDISFGLTLVNLIMYFTIENPDLKIIEELNRNQKLIEKTNEAKSSLTFKLINNIKPELMEIELLSRKNKNDDNLKRINLKVNSVIDSLKEVLDISDMDESKIKVYKATYNIYDLYNEINLIMKSKFDHDAKYFSKINKDAPTLVYGDKIILKQIICSILQNIDEKVSEGNINLNINSILENDVCKFIIEIKSDKLEISLNEINHILNVMNDLDEKKLDNLNTLKVDYCLINKLIKLIGGSLIIKSSKSTGTKFIITLNQKVAKIKKTRHTTKSVLLISERPKLLDNMKYVLDSYYVEINLLTDINDYLVNIQNNDYDYIFVDSMLESPSAITINKELEKLDIDHGKMIILVDPIQEKVKDNYVLKYGYDYRIMISNLEEDIELFAEKFK